MLMVPRVMVKVSIESAPWGIHGRRTVMVTSVPACPLSCALASAVVNVLGSVFPLIDSSTSPWRTPALRAGEFHWGSESTMAESRFMM